MHPVVHLHELCVLGPHTNTVIEKKLYARLLNKPVAVLSYTNINIRPEGRLITENVFQGNEAIMTEVRKLSVADLIQSCRMNRNEHVQRMNSARILPPKICKIPKQKKKAHEKLYCNNSFYACSSSYSQE
jgi:hypothetical protein